MRIYAQIILPIVTFFVLLLVYTKIFGPIPFSINSVTTTKSDTFNVTGDGFVALKPDIASLTVGINARANTVKEAQDQINSIVNKVADAIKSLGVDQKDIQTSHYNISPVYDYQSTPQRINGFLASTDLTVKVRNIDAVNQVIDQATANGANTVSGVIFDVDDKEKGEDEARRKAVDEAKKKAESAAKIAGFRLGKIVNYSEILGNAPLPVRALFAPPAGGITNDTNVEFGSTEIKVTITLSYEIF